MLREYRLMLGANNNRQCLVIISTGFVSSRRQRRVRSESNRGCSFMKCECNSSNEIIIDL